MSGQSDFELPKVLPDAVASGNLQPPLAETSVSSEPVSKSTDNSNTAANTTLMQQAAAASAKDTDLIEKEWVEKTKRIVEQTKDNPYLQNLEIGKFKLEYMQKRHGKEIKVGS